MSDDKKELEPITLDSIKRLRQEGKGLEADIQLATFYSRNQIKNPDNRKRETNQMIKKVRIISKNLGVCADIHCYNIPEEGKTYCRQCLDRYASYQKKKYTNKKRRLE